MAFTKVMAVALLDSGAYAAARLVVIKNNEGNNDNGGIYARGTGSQ